MTSPADDHPDIARSYKAFARLKDPRGSSDSWNLAVEDTLTCTCGWWHPHYDLLTYTTARVERAAAKALPTGLPVNMLDTQGIVDETVVRWRDEGRTIGDDPRAWYEALVTEVVAEEIRHHWWLLAAMADGAIGELASSPTVDDARRPVQPRTIATSESDDRRVAAAIRRLPPSLKITGRLLLAERCAPEEIADLLKIDGEHLGQRVRRIVLALRADAIEIEDLLRPVN
jgi:DNA-directed RNA polymerase specialized sigma24 family protein